MSVIIPTYNRGHFVQRAIDSVLRQTYRKLEVIVVDDASRDDTERIVSAYHDPRIRYVRHEFNRGGSAARNTGIRLAKGEFIAFLDSDDEWMPDKVERHLEVFKSYPECSVVYSAIKAVYPDGTCRIRYHDGPEGKIFDRLMVRNVVGPTSAFVIKRKCFERVGGFDEALPSSQDYDLWLRLAKHYSFKRISKPLVIYHWHGEQISTDVQAKWRGALAILEKYKDELQTMGPHVAAERHFRLGRYLSRVGYVLEGRRHFVQALSMHPWRLRYVVHLISSFLGIYSALSFMKKLKPMRSSKSRGSALK